MKLTSVPSSLSNSTIHLDMSYNQIHTLRNRSLEYLVYLRTLDLSDNGLRQLGLDAFKGLTKLTEMWLHNNLLVVNKICGNVFKNVKQTIGIPIVTVRPSRRLFPFFVRDGIKAGASEQKRKQARSFNFTFRYIDGLLLRNSKFDDFAIYV